VFYSKIDTAMAKIHTNDKGFKVIRTESLSETILLGGIAICDYCNNSSYTGYYIAVLNSWYCDECFNDWYSIATYYKEDASTEERNFNHYAQILGVATN
jgi:hypothetical protein